MSSTRLIGCGKSVRMINRANFLKFLTHFIQIAKPPTDKPVLLFTDNHETHISIEIIENVKENGIILLTLPAHTSNPLQLLDRTVFGPFKSQFSQVADSWMLKHPNMQTYNHLRFSRNSKGSIWSLIYAKKYRERVWSFRHISIQQRYFSRRRFSVLICNRSSRTKTNHDWKPFP